MAPDQYENKTAGELRDIVKAITGELSMHRTIQAESAAEYRKMDSIARQLQDTNMGISKLTSDELSKLKRKNESHIKELQYQAERLAKQKEGASFDGQINEDLINRLKQQGVLNIQEEAILSAAADRYKVEQEITKEVEDQYNRKLAFEKQVNNSLGVSGAILGGIDAVMSKLGVNSGIFKQALHESKESMQDAAEAAALNGTYISKTTTMFKGLGPLTKGFSKALLDPLTIVTKVLDTYFKINKASVDLQHLTGQNAVAAASWGANYATAVDYLETAAALTKQTGMNAQNIFSSKVIGQAAALKTTMGLTADEAGGLATISQTSNQNVNELVDNVVATTSAFNGANRAAVSQGAVLREVANTSDSIKISLGNNPKVLTEAAAAATRLGMSLKDVDGIASSLTDFQSSISNELEAELLTGKDLNLEKARELALSNDLVGLGKELFKNSSSIAEFGKMNRIQQEAEAKALGMTRDQLAKVAYQRALDAGMTSEQAAAAADVNAEDMKRIDIQKNFSQALEKIAGAVAPILDIIGDILSMPLIPYLLMGAFAVAKLGGSLINSAKSMGSLAKGTLDFVKNLNMKGVTDFFGGLKDKFGALKGVFGEGLAGKVQEKVADTGGSITEKLSDKAQEKVGDSVEGVVDKVTGAADKTKNVKAGTGVRDFLSNLGKGLQALSESFKAIGPVGFAYLAAGLALLTGAAIGIGYALGLAAPAIESFGKAVASVLGGVGVVITAIADSFVKLMGAVSMENIGPMLLLGPALFGIAAGLAAIGVAGITAIPGIVGLTALAVIAPALIGLSGAMEIGGESRSAGEAKGKSGEGSLAAVEAKITELIAAVKAGGNVYMDSNKVGRAQVLGSYKSA